MSDYRLEVKHNWVPKINVFGKKTYGQTLDGYLWEIKKKGNHSAFMRGKEPEYADAKRIGQEKLREVRAKYEPRETRRM